MKKYCLALLSASLLAMTLSGCGGSSQSAPSQEASAPVMEQELPGSEPAGAVEASEAENENAHAEERDPVSAYYGTWEVKDYQSAAVSTLSSEDMESFRGTLVTYQPDSVLLDGEQAADDTVAYEAAAVAYDYNGLTEAYQANLGEWWNGISEVTGVTVDSGEGFFGDQFFTADSDTIWIYYEGAFFLAKHVDQ